MDRFFAFTSKGVEGSYIVAILMPTIDSSISVLESSSIRSIHNHMVISRVRALLSVHFEPRECLSTIVDGLFPAECHVGVVEGV